MPDDHPAKFARVFYWLRDGALQLAARESHWKARLLAAVSRRRRDLREESERYRAIVETAVDAILVADRFGAIQSFNRAAERIFGYTADEIVGQNLRLLMQEPERSLHDKYLASYREHGRRKIIGIGREVVGRRKDGSAVPLALSIAEWRDVDGHPRFTGIMRDVTLQHQHEHDLQQAIKAAEQARLEAEAANRAKTEFLANMSHEIRTPLTSIDGYADLLMHTGRLSKQHRRYVGIVQTANKALLTIVNDILDFSKVESGEIELANDPFRLAELVHDTLAIVEPIAARKSLRLKLTLDRRLPEWIVGDVNRLRQILLNLLNNAVKFTDKGSVSVSVERAPVRAGAPSTDGEDPLIHFAVTDTGIGIPHDRLHRLFKRFSQADGSISRRFGGTGLGLAICKRLVDVMGGDIGVISEVGAGTTVWFSVLLPATTQPASAPIAALAEAIAMSKGKILLVDDLETNREIVSAYLKDGGYDVVPAGSGEEALNRLHGETFDLILMDIQMPDMDGVMVTRAIRQMRSPAREIPILAMTGNVLPQQVQGFIKAGMNDHVGKPIERSKLYSVLWRWLPRARADDPTALPASPLFDAAKLEELIDNLGAAKIERTLRLFERQLQSYFHADLDSARREAHDIVNGAGVFGFESLLARARALEATTTDGDDTQRLLAQCRNTRDAVLDMIATTILPQLAAPGYRKTG